VNPAQITAQNGAESSLAGESGAWKVGFPGKGQSVRIKPPQGKWDLRDATQVRVKVKNTSNTAASLTARLDSDPGSTETVASGTLASGASGEIVISFIPPTPWTGIKDSVKTEWNGTKGFGTQFTSDAVTSVTLASEDAAGAHSFEVQSIVAEAPPVILPDWLGKRPPVEGEWTKTFDEEFNGQAIDLTKWNVYTANFWDKTSHFSKENVIVENGLAKLRYAKKRGRHNDDPNGKETDYATGFLDTFGKWVQRYGYFEARMKLPKAPGLWPAMWLMPDRGLNSGAQWLRSSTGEGAMEFDVMEFLSRWGGHRYNIAFHWDGYGKEHKQTGSGTTYTGADKDGFITAGLLWTPGQAVIYCNGSVVARWESPRISNVPSDLMFTHVMGGWDNNGLDDAQLPDEFVIDYVRCWQRKDLASDADGVKSTEATLAAPVKAK
jgi:beta-glucanase (GH16 family)